MPNTRCPCGKKIGRREVRLNGGLCDKCLQDTLREIARKLAKKK